MTYALWNFKARVTSVVLRMSDGIFLRKALRKVWEGGREEVEKREREREREKMREDGKEER